LHFVFPVDFDNLEKERLSQISKESRDETGRVEGSFALFVRVLIVFDGSELFDDGSYEFERKKIEITSRRRRGRSGRIGRHAVMVSERVGGK